MPTPRLRTSMSVSLDQQTGAGGGGFTSRGSGETKLEESRRRITSQMVRIRQELAELSKGTSTRSAKRTTNELANVALVGYTNAGKSTLMNRLSPALASVRTRTTPSKSLKKTCCLPR